MKKIGLGTIVEFILKPYAILAGKEDCERCHQRRDRLNQIMPDALPVVIIAGLLILFILI